MPEELVVIQLLTECHEMNAMIDSRASVSVTDDQKFKCQNNPFNVQS